jgi:hypothetical protein
MGDEADTTVLSDPGPSVFLLYCSHIVRRHIGYVCAFIAIDHWEDLAVRLHLLFSRLYMRRVGALHAPPNRGCRHALRRIDRFLPARTVEAP